MSRIRKHVTLAMHQEIKAPGDGQRIVRAAGTRGGNIVEVEYPDGKQTLCMLPAKFNKKLWVRRGGYLLIDESPEAEGDSKVTGTIVAVLYGEHIRQLKKLPGVWPQQFDDAAEVPLEPESTTSLAEPEGNEDGNNSDSDEDYPDDPLLQPNTNRQQITHYVSDSEDDD